MVAGPSYRIRVVSIGDISSLEKYVMASKPSDSAAIAHNIAVSFIDTSKA